MQGDGWVRSFQVAVGALAAVGLTAATLPAQVAPLGHPTVEERIARLGIDPRDGFRFVVFGDQKNLWKRDFPALLDRVAREASKPDLLFMLDSGDIVDDGGVDAQFEELRQHLARVSDLPYLVGVGNHELQPAARPARRTRAHRNTMAFLGDDYSEGRLYFARRIGRVRLLFLNTNDLPGVYPGLHTSDLDAGARAAAQLRWLDEELRVEVHPTVVVSHHAFVQSAPKHRDHATTLWNRSYDALGGRTLPERLIEGGVDLVLAGHVHSYEAFRLERGGRRMWSINASGMPTGSIFRLPWRRMPRNWQGDELDQLDDAGFETRLDEWRVTQLGFMTRETRRNQFVLVAVDAAGAMDLEIRGLDDTVLYRLRIPAAAS